MKILLAALNARYSHTNLAIRYLRNALNANGFDACIYETAINDNDGKILRDLYIADADVYCFSCYIWNIEKTLKAAADLKKVLPQADIILGGPEVSYDASEIKANNPFISYIICGEGESAIIKLAKALEKGEKADIKGYFYEDINNLVYPYNDGEITALKDKIIYYESSRGCPYSCSFCLSGREGGVRLLNIDRVKTEITKITDEGAYLLKFVDRTFNCDTERAYKLFEFLINLPCQTRFHFEIRAELLREKDFKLLEKAPENKFQFEVGIQSANADTLNCISRKADSEKAINSLKRLKELKNIHIHADLIAGLPFEDINSFKTSFNTVYPYCDVLQLGFLKVLKGSEIREKAKEFEIDYTDKAPYEVLSTKWLSFDDILKLKAIEETLERFSNSKAFNNSLEYLLKFFASPFDFFEIFSKHLDNNNMLYINISKKDDYSALLDFAKQIKGVDIKLFIEYLRLDYITIFRGEPSFGNNSFYLKKHSFFADTELINKLLPEYNDLQSKNIAKYCDIHLFNISEKKILLFDRRNGKIVDITAHKGKFTV